MKEAHLVLCFDGTAQNADQDIKSNAFKISECARNAYIPPGLSQDVEYFEGVGATQRTMLQRGIHQWGGFGVKGQFILGYMRMCDFASEHPDDKIRISMLGFSRGFFVALMLRKAKHKIGLQDYNRVAANRGTETLSKREKLQLANEAWRLYHSDKKPSHSDMIAYREKNSFPESLDFYLYAFDPVAKFVGYKVVEDETGEEFTLHDSKLPKGTKAYIELLAADEQRNAYKIMPVNTPDHYDIIRRSIIMPGDHACVGGSCSAKREPLADVAGLEMLNLMQEHSGLWIDTQIRDYLFSPDEFACLDGYYHDPVAVDLASHWITSVWNGTGPRAFSEEAEIHPSLERRAAERTSNTERFIPQSFVNSQREAQHTASVT